jgi:hypothetical protein
MRLLPLLLAVAALTPARPARAIPEGAPFSLFTPDGPDPTGITAVGTISFVMDGQAGGACRYYAEWDGAGADQQLTVGCWIDEGKTRGHGSCAKNGAASFATSLRVAPDRACAGFDVFGVPRAIFLWSAMESEGGFVGLIQWTAAAAYVVPVEAAPYP